MIQAHHKSYVIRQPAGGDPDSVEILVPATNVPSFQSEFTMWIPFDDPDIQNSPGFLDACLAGAVNAQAWSGDKTEEFARHVTVTVDLTGGGIWVTYEGMSDVVDNWLVLYASGMGSDYSVTDPHGRNETFRNYQLFFDYQELITSAVLPDLTGNGYDLNIINFDVNDQVFGKIGKAYSNPTSSNKLLKLANNKSFSFIESSYSVGGWVKVDKHSRLASYDSSSQRLWQFKTGGPAGKTRFIRFSGGNAIILEGSVDNSGIDYKHFVATWDNVEGADIYNNSALDASNNNVSTNNTAFGAGFTIFILARESGTQEQDHALSWMRSFKLPADTVDLEYRNQNDFSSFATEINEITF